MIVPYIHIVGVASNLYCYALVVGSYSLGKLYYVMYILHPWSVENNKTYFEVLIFVILNLNILYNYIMF